MRRKEDKPLRQAIRDLSSPDDLPPRFCDVIVEKGTVTLEVKSKKPVHSKISWEDLQHQVNAAIKRATCE